MYTGQPRNLSLQACFLCHVYIFYREMATLLAKCVTFEESVRLSSMVHKSTFPALKSSSEGTAMHTRCAALEDDSCLNLMNRDWTL